MSKLRVYVREMDPLVKKMLGDLLVMLACLVALGVLIALFQYLVGRS